MLSSKFVFRCLLSSNLTKFSPAFQRTLDGRNYSTPTSFVGQDFKTLKDFTPTEVEQFLWTSLDLKKRIKVDRELYQPLKGKCLATIFQKRSTRTRLSTESGFGLLGGQSIFLGPQDVHIGVSESIKDSARVISRMTDLMLARVFGHEIIEELAAESDKPVINGLSDLYHPLQTLADLMTMQEHFGYLKGLKLGYVGDGNNIIHSLMMGCCKVGMEVRVATPKGYEVDSRVNQDAVNISKETGAKYTTSYDPMEAVNKADVVVTDTWISMGQEEEKQQRLKDFKGYQVNQKMIDTADANSVFMHCLPRKQEEVTDDVFYSDRSIVWQEAENRKWTVMAVMLHLLMDYTPKTPKPNFTKQ